MKDQFSSFIVCKIKIVIDFENIKWFRKESSIDSEPHFLTYFDQQILFFSVTVRNKWDA